MTFWSVELRLFLRIKTLTVIAVVTLGSLLECPRFVIAADVPLTTESNIHFATAEEARAIVVAQDMYLENMTPLDRELRLRSAKPVSEDDYKAFAAKQMLDWHD